MLEPRALPVELKAQVGVLSVADLWLSCFALGTMRSPLELEGLLRGTLRPTRHEYLIAVALNEYLSDIGVSQLVPYVETMATYLSRRGTSRQRSRPDCPGALSSPTRRPVGGELALTRPRLRKTPWPTAWRRGRAPTRDDGSKYFKA